jgi:transcriptional regulator with XRE-family HTH domain
VDWVDDADTIDSFPDRLKMAIGAKSARSFAMQSGLSPTVIHQYLAGKSEPTRLALIAIASTAEVNLEWLITGNGAMLKEKGSVLINREMYDGIIEAVEEYLAEDGLELLPSKKIETYHYLFDLFKDQPGINKMQVGKTLRLVA